MANTLDKIPGTLVLSLAFDAGAATSYQVDNSWVFGTSGKAVLYRFSAPASQTSASLTIYAYCTTTTGSPTFKAELRDSAPSGDDADRPDAGASALATTGDVTPTSGRWVTFTFSSASLTSGASYWIVIYNSHATPASNHASWQHRAAIDGMAPQVSATAAILSGYSADGCTTDPTTTVNSNGPAVIKFSNGTMFGNPYVIADSAHANNTNLRGNRLTTPATLEFAGMYGSVSGAAADRVAIYDGSTLKVQSETFDQVAEARTLGLRFPATSLAAGTYDFVQTFSANSTGGTIYTMGETEANLPADVLACRPWSVAYVDGASAGSLTADPTKIFAMSVLISDIPAAGGSTVIVVED